MRQLRVELKLVKKGNNPIIEYIFHVKAIVTLLLVVGDVVSEHNQIDSILDGLPK